MQTGFLGALTSHPLLLIRHWAPFMPLLQLLQLLHAFLQVRGGVNFSLYSAALWLALTTNLLSSGPE